MTRGQPRKRTRDTMGLRNQPIAQVPTMGAGDNSGLESGPEQETDHDEDVRRSLDEEESDDMEEASPWEDLDNEEALEKLVERPDVVKYRNETFLPALARFEARMAHYEGPELKKVEPKLAADEKQVIALFHDESSFRSNDQHGTSLTDQ